MSKEDEKYIQLLAKAIAHMLVEGEGVFVEISNSKALIHKREESIIILDAIEEPDFEDGRMVWFHDDAIVRESSDIPHFDARKARKMFAELTDLQRSEIMKDFCHRCFRALKKNEVCVCHEA